jgi:exonuclease III
VPKSNHITNSPSEKRMRIIEWNCQGAFRLKNKEILELNPDILIVPECEQEGKLKFGQLTPHPTDFLWYGDTGKKGIAIFSYSKYKFKILKEFNPAFRFVVPLEVTDGKNSFLLFAIWAMDNKSNPLARYIGQVWNAINYYETILSENSILIGDFNSNRIWDTKDRVANHTDVVNFLKQQNIESLYHKQFDEEHGIESIKTFFMYRNIEKAYHIDYVFASHNIIENGYNLTLETSENWIDKSDHIPLILDLQPFESSLKMKHTFQDFANRHIQSLTNLQRQNLVLNL